MIKAQHIMNSTGQQGLPQKANTVNFATIIDWVHRIQFCASSLDTRDEHKLNYEQNL